MHSLQRRGARGTVVKGGERREQKNRSPRRTVITQVKIKEYESGKEGDVANDLGNREKGDRKRKGGRDTDWL